MLYLIECHCVVSDIMCVMYQGVVGGPSRGSRASSQAGFGVRQPQYEEEEIIPEEQQIQVLHLYCAVSPLLIHQSFEPSCCHRQVLSKSCNSTI